MSGPPSSFSMVPADNMAFQGRQQGNGNGGQFNPEMYQQFAPRPPQGNAMVVTSFAPQPAATASSFQQLQSTIVMSPPPPGVTMVQARPVYSAQQGAIPPQLSSAGSHAMMNPSLPLSVPPGTKPANFAGQPQQQLVASQMGQMPLYQQQQQQMQQLQRPPLPQQQLNAPGQRHVAASSSGGPGQGHVGVISAASGPYQTPQKPVIAQQQHQQQRQHPGAAIPSASQFTAVPAAYMQSPAQSMGSVPTATPGQNRGLPSAVTPLVPVTPKGVAHHTASEVSPDMIEDMRLMQGGFSNRLLLALQSRLPNEIDWAVTTLLVLSYRSDRFRVQAIPGLLDVLVGICFDVIVNEMIDEDSDDEVAIAEDDEDLVVLSDHFTARTPTSSLVSRLFETQEDREQLTRAAIIMCTFCNWAHQPINARFLLASQAFMSLMLRTLRLSDFARPVELRRVAAETIEVLSPLLTVEPPSAAKAQAGGSIQIDGTASGEEVDVPTIDEFSRKPLSWRIVRALQRHILEGEDLFMVQISMRIIAHLAHHWHNEGGLLALLDKDVIHRAARLLQVPGLDPNSALEYFYQMTCAPELSRRVADILLAPVHEEAGGLGKCILHVFTRHMTKGIPSIPHLSNRPTTARSSGGREDRKPGQGHTTQDLKCKWQACMHPPFSDFWGLASHVKSAHTHGQSCHWASCNWKRPHKDFSMAAHLRTHLPEFASLDDPPRCSPVSGTSSGATAMRRGRTSQQLQPQSQLLDADGPSDGAGADNLSPEQLQALIESERKTDPQGVAYTSALILRNLAQLRARSEVTLEAMRSIKQDLRFIAERHPRLSKCVEEILMELN